MENKNGTALDDDALEEAAGGYLFYDRSRGKYYSVDSRGNIDWNSGHRNKAKVEVYNDKHCISNREIDCRELSRLRIKDFIDRHNKKHEFVD